MPCFPCILHISTHFARDFVPCFISPSVFTSRVFRLFCFSVDVQQSVCGRPGTAGAARAGHWPVPVPAGPAPHRGTPGSGRTRPRPRQRAAQQRLGAGRGHRAAAAGLSAALRPRPALHRADSQSVALARRIRRQSATGRHRGAPNDPLRPGRRQQRPNTPTSGVSTWRSEISSGVLQAVRSNSQ